ncbi:hypothetical protein [Escherichia coli]
MLSIYIIYKLIVLSNT